MGSSVYSSGLFLFLLPPGWKIGNAICLYVLSHYPTIRGMVFQSHLLVLPLSPHLVLFSTTKPTRPTIEVFSCTLTIYVFRVRHSVFPFPYARHHPCNYIVPKCSLDIVVGDNSVAHRLENKLQCRRKNDHKWFTGDIVKLRQFKPKKQIMNARAWGRQNSGVYVIACSVRGWTTVVGTERNADFVMS